MKHYELFYIVSVQVPETQLDALQGQLGQLSQEVRALRSLLLVKNAQQTPAPAESAPASQGPGERQTAPPESPEDARERAEAARAEQERLTKRHTANPEAFRLYLLGRFHWNKRSKEGLQRGADYFQKAIAEDPTYALAYSGLADSYL